MPEYARQSRAVQPADAQSRARAGRGIAGETRLAQLRSAADAAPAVQRLAALQRAADARAQPAQRVEDEELLQGKMMQRVEDEDLLQGKAIQRLEEDEPLQGDRLQRQAPARSDGLPADLRQGVESLSGISMADVRVHRNSAKPAQVGAHAYAQGSDIHLAPGQERHLPHEAWHVVQQAQGRVQPTMSVNGTAVNDDAGLEREADGMGARAALPLASQAPRQMQAERVEDPGGTSNPAIQRIAILGDKNIAGNYSFLPTYDENGNPFLSRQDHKLDDLMVYKIAADARHNIQIDYVGNGAAPQELKPKGLVDEDKDSPFMQTVGNILHNLRNSRDQRLRVGNTLAAFEPYKKYSTKASSPKDISVFTGNQDEDEKAVFDKSGDSYIDAFKSFFDEGGDFDPTRGISNLIPLIIGEQYRIGRSGTGEDEKFKAVDYFADAAKAAGFGGGESKPEQLLEVLTEIRDWERSRGKKGEFSLRMQDNTFPVNKDGKNEKIKFGALLEEDITYLEGLKDDAVMGGTTDDSRINEIKARMLTIYMPWAGKGGAASARTKFGATKSHFEGKRVTGGDEASSHELEEKSESESSGSGEKSESESSDSSMKRKNEPGNNESASKRQKTGRSDSEEESEQ